MSDEHLVWKKTDEKPFKGAFKTYLTRTFELPNGTVADFDVTSLKSGKFVGCLALTDAMEVIISKEFRPGPEIVTYDAPLGIVDPGEDPNDAVRRELREETGHVAGKLIVLNPDGNAVGPYDAAMAYYYLALECEQKYEQQLDEHEPIEVATMPLRDFVNQKLRKGQVCHADGAWLAIDYLLQNSMITLEDIAL
jgi:ADP-ribose pyrophosphatase